MKKKKKAPSIEDIEKVLKLDSDVSVEILPDGSVKTKKRKAKVLTRGESLPSYY